VSAVQCVIACVHFCAAPWPSSSNHFYSSAVAGPGKEKELEGKTETCPSSAPQGTSGEAPQHDAKDTVDGLLNEYEHDDWFGEGGPAAEEGEVPDGSGASQVRGMAGICSAAFWHELVGVSNIVLRAQVFTVQLFAVCELQGPRSAH